MLIYARNQTFCSKSVNKAPKILIFGLNILCIRNPNHVKNGVPTFSAQARAEVGAQARKFLKCLKWSGSYPKLLKSDFENF